MLRDAAGLPSTLPDASPPRKLGMKALGTGHTPGGPLARCRGGQGLEVRRNCGSMAGLSADSSSMGGERAALVTITHSDTLALAQVLLLGRRDELRSSHTRDERQLLLPVLTDTKTAS